METIIKKLDELYQELHMIQSNPQLSRIDNPDVRVQLDDHLDDALYFIKEAKDVLKKYN